MRGVALRSSLLAAIALCAMAHVGAVGVSADSLQRGLDAAMADPEGAVADPSRVTDPITQPPQSSAPDVPDEGADTPGFTDRVAQAFASDVMVAGAAGVGLVALGLAGYALVGRYVDPKVALENPQRSMLYGFVRGNPGVHLKKLSDEFAMKTSSILWHMRKLEAAQLVRSDRANGFRVFYPVEGGQHARNLSRAIANLRNGNAIQVFQAIAQSPGTPTPEVVRALGIHPGTARWHVRRMRDAGLLEELVGATGSRLFPTELGRRALDAAKGGALDPPAATPRPAAPLVGARPSPVPEA